MLSELIACLAFKPSASVAVQTGRAVLEKSSNSFSKIIHDSKKAVL